MMPTASSKNMRPASPSPVTSTCGTDWCIGGPIAATPSSYKRATNSSPDSMPLQMSSTRLFSSIPPRALHNLTSSSYNLHTHWLFFGLIAMR